MRELVENQSSQLEGLERRMAALERTGQQNDDEEAVAPGGYQSRGWRPPSRRPGMPNAGVITVEEPLDGDHAFGPAARLEAEWRRLLAGGGQMVGQVDHAKAAVRRRELEAAMLGEYHLSLPPETHPLDDVRRRDHVRWRQEALAEARRELAMAQRSRLLRRILTLGLWRK